jgi:hypothetical protein
MSRPAHAVLPPALALAVLLAGAPPAAAAVERFAVLIGNDSGDADEANLRYAEADAGKMSEVLLELGGFSSENVVLLRGEGPTAVRRALRAVHQRILARAAGSQILLLVYYSGHADASALHLGGGHLPLAELEGMVRGAPASVRLLLLDSCRSGSLTRTKGGVASAGFSIEIDDDLASQGVIVMTSSAANEDAQESDDLRGSFFTHYLASGLRGAADLTGDGMVSVAEAYRYAYDSTLRASSRTLAGVQHASFRYDLSGHGDLVLTRLVGQTGPRARLQFPPLQSYLVMRDDAGGPVIAEVALRDARRRITVRPGRYFVRGRGRDHLLEGTVQVRAGEDRVIDPAKLRRIAYARLVRKGVGLLELAHGPEAGLRGRGSLDNSDRACVGGFAGYSLEFPGATVGARLGWCRSGFVNDTLDSSLDELDVELRAGKAWDLPVVTLMPLVAAGGGLFHQRFGSRGDAPSRTSALAHVDAGLAVSADLSGRFYAAVEVSARTYFFRQRSAGDQLGADFTVAISTALGWHL